MAEEKQMNLDVEAKSIEAKFNAVVAQKNQLVEQRSQIDKKLNEFGVDMLRLQGEYAAVQRLQGKGNGKELDPNPQKKKPTETTVKKKK